MALDDSGHFVPARGVDLVDLVDHHHVGELDLLGQQAGQAAVVVVTGHLAALAEQVGTAVVGQQVEGVDHGHHGVDAGHVVQRLAFFASEVEGGGHRQRLADAGGLDQQIVEAAFRGQALDLQQQVFAQRAADAAVAHFHKLLVSA
jgi:hypothetical protein